MLRDLEFIFYLFFNITLSVRSFCDIALVLLLISNKVHDTSIVKRNLFKYICCLIYSVILMATRTEIQDYLYIRDSIDETVNAILNKTIPMDSIASISNILEKNIIKLTIANVEGRKRYLNEKSLYEAAVNDFKKLESSNNEEISKIAKTYGINDVILSEEINKFLKIKYYVYDQIIEAECTSYVQEETLWQLLKQLVNLKKIPCTCRICFLLESSKQVDEFAKLWCLSYNHSGPKVATIGWVRCFEMRYRSEISDLCSKKCTLKNDECESQ